MTKSDRCAPGAEMISGDDAEIAGRATSILQVLNSRVCAGILRDRDGFHRLVNPLFERLISTALRLNNHRYGAAIEAEGFREWAADYPEIILAPHSPNSFSIVTSNDRRAWVEMKFRWHDRMTVEVHAE